MTRGLDERSKVLVLSAGAAAGQTDHDSAVLDMQDYDHAVFETVFGAIDPTATPQVAVHESDTAVFGAEIAATQQVITDADDNKVVLHDLIRPKKRYLGVRVKRDLVAADSTVLCILARLYKARSEPVTQDAGSVAASATYVGAGN